MGAFQNIKKQMLPLIKGTPVVLIVFVAAIFIAKKVIQYTPTMYLSVAKIKLDNQKYGFSNNALYQNFDVFTAEEKIETEAEILGSHLLIKKALEKVDFKISMERLGSIKNTSLYGNSPIQIATTFLDDELYDVLFQLSIENDQLTLTQDFDGAANVYQGSFDVPFNINGNQLTITKNDSLIQLKNLQVDGNYSFTIHSEEGAINKIKEQLDVTAVDKEMSVLRVVFKDHIPSKTADFNNALCEAYIEDYIDAKSFAATKTVQFIDLKLLEVGEDLSKAEHQLEKYKMNNDVVNTRQETETGLRQISNLKIQLVNTEMNEKAILELEEYISKGEYFDETAINFGFGDLLMTELVKKMKLWNDEKQDLLIKYKEGSDQINAVNNKIAEVKKYIKEAIKSNKREIITKKEKLEAELAILSTQFEGIPTREKDLQILEREFRLQESVYNFLAQKRIEAAIASTANTAFHRIIQPAYPPKKPIAPNKTLILFVSGLLGLIIGIVLVYIREFARAKVTDKSDLERNSELPVAGIIRNVKNNLKGEYLTLVKALLLKKKLTGNQVITVSSSIAEEGKTISVEELGVALMSLGYKICLVDADDLNHGLLNTFHEAKDITNLQETDLQENGIVFTTKYNTDVINQAFFEQQLSLLKNNYDFVLIDTSATSISITPIQLMKWGDINLYVVRANFTPLSHINNADLLAEEYEIKNLELLLTNAHKASNYNGTLIGTRFQHKKTTGIVNKIKSYIQYYIN